MTTGSKLVLRVWGVVALALLPGAAGTGVAPDLPTTLHVHLGPDSLGSESPELVAMSRSPPPGNWTYSHELRAHDLSCHNGVATSFVQAFLTQAVPHYENGSIAWAAYPPAVQFAPSMRLHWYLEPVDADVVLPQVTVDAEIRVGFGNDTTLVAFGASESTLLSPASPLRRMTPEGKVVYAVEVDVHSVVGSAVPPAQDVGNVIILLVRTHLQQPACAGLMPAVLAFHTSPDFRPRLEGVTLDALTLHGLSPVPVDDRLVVVARLDAAWDEIDWTNATVTVAGPMDTVLRPHLMGAHNDGERQTLGLAFTWHYAEQNAPQGHYTLTLEVGDWTRQARLNATAQFILGPEPHGIDDQGRRVDPSPAQEAPVLLLPTILALAATAWACRRGLP